MTFMRRFMDMLNMTNQNNGTKTVKNVSYSSDLFKIYNGSLSKRKEEIISRDILSTIGLCSANNLCKEARDYLDQKHSRIETCVYAANLCIPAINNNELYLVSHAFQWAGAKYRKEAISYTKEFILKGTISDYIPCYICSQYGTSFDQRIKFIAIEHQNLAILYSKEYMFREAIAELQIALQIAPYLLSIYSCISQNYVKLGDYESALSILHQAQNTKYYKQDNTMRKLIDNSINNVIHKKEQGYVYKPRNKKN